jgi:DNA primase
MPLMFCKPSQGLIDIVAALGGTWHGLNAMCRCPVHDDRTPSLSLRRGEQAILVHCFAGCDRKAILL